MRIFGTNLTWVDTVELVGVILGLLGLFLTYQQVTQTKTAAEAAAKAIRETQSRVTGNLILVLLGQLEGIDREFDTVKADDRGAGLRLVHQWRKVGGEVQGFVSGLLKEDHTFITKLEDSIALSTAAKDALRENTTSSVHDSTIELRESIGLVCADIGSITATLVKEVGGPSG